MIGTFRDKVEAGDVITERRWIIWLNYMSWTSLINRHRSKASRAMSRVVHHEREAMRLEKERSKRVKTISAMATMRKRSETYDDDWYHWWHAFLPWCKYPCQGEPDVSYQKAIREYMKGKPGGPAKPETPKHTRSVGALDEQIENGDIEKLDMSIDSRVDGMDITRQEDGHVSATFSGSKAIHENHNQHNKQKGNRNNNQRHN